MQTAVRLLAPQGTRGHAIRRRLFAAGVVVIVLASLILLPEMGLRRIQHHESRSHQLDVVLASANASSSEINALIAGPLRLQGEAPGPATNLHSSDALARARSTTYSLAGLLGIAGELDIERPLFEYIASSLVYLEQAERRHRLSAQGIPVPEQPGRPEYVQAQGRHIDTYQALLNDMVRINGIIETDRASAMTRARQLQALAIGIAVVAAGISLALEWRRITATFSRERGRAEAAERQAEHRGAIVNLASHELRNPLAVMSLAAQMMLETAKESGNTEMALAATDGLAAARRSEAVVAELLDLARLDANRLELETRAVPLDRALDHAVELAISHRGPRPVVIAGTPRREVVADPGRLAIIIRNMVDNAFKYSPEGTPIEILVHPAAGGVAIDVIDAGPGVPPEDRERVFNRYERLTATQHIAGLGIGLHLSRELARRMGGDLSFRDSERGARLRLVLPAEQTVATTIEERRSA